MRHRYLVCYDVSNDKRLRMVHKTMLGYGDPMQYSVFCCDLAETERLLMVAAVLKHMNQREDRLMIANLGPTKARGKVAIEWHGKNPGFTERRVVIV